MLDNPTFSVIFVDFWIFQGYAWCVVLTDPFKDAAATWLVPSASLAHGHFHCLWIGALVLDVVDHGLVGLAGAEDLRALDSGHDGENADLSFHIAADACAPDDICMGVKLIRHAPMELV